MPGVSLRRLIGALQAPAASGSNTTITAVVGNAPSTGVVAQISMVGAPSTAPFYWLIQARRRARR